MELDFDKLDSIGGKETHREPPQATQTHLMDYLSPNNGNAFREALESRYGGDNHARKKQQAILDGITEGRELAALLIEACNLVSYLTENNTFSQYVSAELSVVEVSAYMQDLEVPLDWQIKTLEKNIAALQGKLDKLQRERESLQEKEI